MAREIKRLRKASTAEAMEQAEAREAQQAQSKAEERREEMETDAPADESVYEQSEITEKQARRLGRMQFVLVALLFIVAICVTEAISYFLGAVAGTVALVIIAAVTAVLLYHKEIKAYFRKNKGQ